MAYRLIHIDIFCAVLFGISSTRYPMLLLCLLTITLDSFNKIHYCFAARANKKWISTWEILEEKQMQVLLLLHPKAIIHTLFLTHQVYWYILQKWIQKSSLITGGALLENVACSSRTLPHLLDCKFPSSGSLEHTTFAGITASFVNKVRCQHLADIHCP